MIKWKSEKGEKKKCPKQKYRKSGKTDKTKGKTAVGGDKMKSGILSIMITILAFTIY